MSKFKLTYFNVPARGEVARLLFFMSGVDFEDERIDKEKEWPTLKEVTPFGQLPLLEIDDQTIICQSSAINRYLGKKFGYAGKTDLEEAQVDMVYGCVEDCFAPLVQKIIRAPTKDEKARNSKIYLEEELPVFLKRFEKFLLQNPTKSGYFVGNQITIADMHFVERLASLWERFDMKVDMQPYPNCKRLYELVRGHPKIAEYKAKGYPMKFK